MTIIDTVLKEGRTKLSEWESSQFLESYGIPLARQLLVQNRPQLVEAVGKIGFPLVLKGCSPSVSHKTDLGIVRLDIRSEEEALLAYDEIRSKMNGSGTDVIVQEMVKGQRELMAGLVRDPQFGPCVMFGLGGIFTEILQDVAFRLAPLDEKDAYDLMRDIRGHRILDGVRGMEPVDSKLLAQILMTLGNIGLENPRIKEVDINPLIVRGAKPIAVDTLIVLE